MVVFAQTIECEIEWSNWSQTFLITYRFSDVVRVYQAGMGTKDFLRPRFEGEAESHPEGFVQAVEGVISNLEKQEGDGISKTTEGKQDLSSV